MTITARPTLYKGIQMRSRLEADFAAWLDAGNLGETWEYEPQCFAGTTRDGEAVQYLPDFRVRGRTGNVIYIELKPSSMELTEETVIPILKRMEVIRQSEPAAGLHLVFRDWGNDNGAQFLSIGSPVWQAYLPSCELSLTVNFPPLMPWNMVNKSRPTA